MSVHARGPADPAAIGADAAGTDLAALRATAHPTRRSILALLREHTTLTASECGRLLGMSPKVCSYHLRVLAEQHLVEEVPASGRNRPWRRADTIPTEAPVRRADDLVRADPRRLRVRVRRDDELLGTASAAIARAAHDSGWSDAVTVHTHLGSMTADEIARWAEDVERVTRRHVRRAAADASAAHRRSPVQMLFVGFPTAI
jgi:DNA-binding transcriptional ArsR family regulator